MPSTLIQRNLYDINPVHKEFMFALKNDAAVSGIPIAYYNVKFVAEVHIAGDTINLSVVADVIATLKVIPNNEGVGIFDFSQICESFVRPQNMGFADTTVSSEWKGNPFTYNPHSIHIIDKFCLNDKGFKNLAAQLKVEASTSVGGPVSIVSNSAINVTGMQIFNGYLTEEAVLTRTGSTASLPISYGWSELSNYFSNGTSDFVLSNAPAIQYANEGDYGVMCFFNRTSYPITSVEYDLRDFSNTSTIINVTNVTANGGAPPTSKTNTQMLSVGVFPGNLMNTNATFYSMITGGTLSHYFVYLKQSGGRRTQKYRININCSPDGKGYEPIRLAWLNQLGGWDYYTFTKKSTVSLATKKTTYTQLAGTWNGIGYEVQGWKGGKKAFRVNATETIKMNTDFISEDDANWFEFLINSPEVYIIKPYALADTDAQKLTNRYVIPVRLKTSKYVRKTVANNRLIQYTFEIEKSKKLRTQNA